MTELSQGRVNADGSEFVDLRCTFQTAALEEPPAGTMGDDDRYVLVELPLPWPKKIDQHPSLPSFAMRGRLLAIAPNEPTELATVICYDRPPGAFRSFERREARVDPADLDQVFQDLQRDDFSRFDADTADAAAGSTTDHVIDVLVCTHGSRDRCCGQFGARLFMDLTDRQAHGEWDSRVRVWRTSHIGGHRFAPTAMTFPDAMGWAWLDIDSLAGITDRTLDIHIAAEMARGSGGVAGKAAQVADVRGFAHHGWAWLDAPRSATVVSDGDREIVTLESTLGVGTIELRHGEPIPVPTCGEKTSTKSTRQLEVVSETW